MPKNVYTLWAQLASKGERHRVFVYCRGKKCWVELPGLHGPAEAALLAMHNRKHNRAPVAVQPAQEGGPDAS